jgi:starch phosphorylase
MSAVSLDYLVSGRQQRFRDGEAERFGGIEIERQLEFSRRRHRQIGRLLALEDATGIGTDLAIYFGTIGSVTHQSAFLDYKAVLEARSHPMTRRQRDDLLAPLEAQEEIAADEQRIETPLGQRRKGVVNLARSAGHQHINLLPDGLRCGLHVAPTSFGLRVALHLLRGVPRDGNGDAADDPARNVARVRERCVFTTHTPVEAGTDRFPYELVTRTLGNLEDYLELLELKRLAGDDRLNMTRLALTLSGYVNGPSKRHAQTTAKMFPGCDVRAITNGVHAATWTHASFARLYDAALPQWALEPEVLERADQISDEAIWAAHQEAKRELLARVTDLSSVELRPDLPVIGFARRMTEYKSAGLLFEDIERLAEIARRWPFQAVFAGLAHPRDEGGRSLIVQIHRHIRQLSNTVPMVFLANYDMEIAASLVAGADIWLNTPLPPLEASGTSGMKAALNGVLNFSVLDGWWVEGHIEGVTGWAIGDGEAGSVVHRSDADDLHRTLENVVLPLYYDDRARWIWLMKQSISKIGSYFNSTRMMRRYAAEAYLH